MGERYRVSSKTASRISCRSPFDDDGRNTGFQGPVWRTWLILKGSERCHERTAQNNHRNQPIIR
jgi:hypothetical protein